MEPVYGQILLRGYGIRLYRTSRSRTGILCDTDCGMLELKRVSGEEGRSSLDMQARKLLADHGFSYALPILPTLSGDILYRTREFCFQLEPYVPVADDIESSLFSRSGAQLLASFHIAAQGLTLPVERQNFHTLPELFEKRKRELCRIRKRISSQSSYSAADLLILHYFGDYFERVCEAEGRLKEAGYEFLCAAALSDGCFCHNAFKGDNIRENKDGLWLTGFDRITGDLPVCDLADYLRRYLRWDAAVPQEGLSLLAAYEEIRPLSTQEKEVLYALLTYPERFLKLLNGIYNKRKAALTEAMVQKLERCIRLRTAEKGLLACLRNE